MTKTANITWSLPTTRSNGKPQVLAELDYTVVSFSVNGGLDYAQLDQVAAVATQGVTIPDLVDGDYGVRLRVYDDAGKFGADVDTLFVIDTSVPGAVTDVQITLT